jgi:hypothetical protein
VVGNRQANSRSGLDLQFSVMCPHISVQYISVNVSDVKCLVRFLRVSSYFAESGWL